MKRLSLALHSKTSKQLLASYDTQEVLKLCGKSQNKHAILPQVTMAYLHSQSLQHCRVSACFHAAVCSLKSHLQVSVHTAFSRQYISLEYNVDF